MALFKLIIHFEVLTITETYIYHLPKIARIKHNQKILLLEAKNLQTNNAIQLQTNKQTIFTDFLSYI